MWIREFLLDNAHNMHVVLIIPEIAEACCVILLSAIGSTEDVKHLMDTLTHADIFQYHASCQNPHPAEAETPCASNWAKPLTCGIVRRVDGSNQSRPTTVIVINLTQIPGL